MEWMNRGQGQGQPAGQPVHHSPNPAAAQPAQKKKRGLNWIKGVRLAQIVLLFSVTVLIVAVVWFLALGGGKNEDSFVDKSKMQAVFLSGGQVYFGDINELNSRYMGLSNIYYLRVNQQVQPDQSTSNNSNDVSLVKLGCELHGPQDTMIINRDQIIFWENLKDDGQVAKAVKEYHDQNPNGQKCDTTNNTGTNNSNATGTTDNSNNSSNNNGSNNNSGSNNGN